MPDREPTGFSRVCPACERRVPQSVTTCRCGAVLAPEYPLTTPDSAESQPQRRSTSILLVVLIAAAVAGTVYRGWWIVNRPSRTIVSIQGSKPYIDPDAIRPAASPE